jgi:hypothetical protein
MLAAVFHAFRLRFGTVAAAAFGNAGLTFLSLPLVVVLLMGGMALGCLGGYAVARRVA